MKKSVNKFLDTIVAISSGNNINQAISIIRISGKDSTKIIKKIFNGKIGTDKTITYGHIIDPDTKEFIDEVLVAWFIGTNNYTGEDTIEINAHGGILVTNKILSLILNNGARMAEKGEFTRRAYLNGKITLEKAEAINSLIHAKTNIQRKVAASQFKDKTYPWIKEIENELMSIVGLIEVNIDYSDYNDIEQANPNDLLEKCINLINKIKNTLDISNKLQKVSSGTKVAIVGNVNTGKSTLFNLLIDKDQAIITDIPGTTRDVNVSEFSINGIVFELLDTAGLRDTTDVVESIGIKKAISSIDEADVIIYLFEPSDLKINNNIKEKIKNKKNVLFVLNKIDLLTNKQKQTKEIKDMIWISAKNKNAYELKNALVKSFIGIEEKINNPVFNERKVSELNKCISNIENCINGLKAKMSLDVVVVDLLEGLANIKSSLNEDYDTEDILNHIFSKFCLGK